MNDVAVEPWALKKFWLLPIALQPRTWRCSAHCTELRRGTDALCADVPDAWNCPPKPRLSRQVIQSPEGLRSNSSTGHDWTESRHED